MKPLLLIALLSACVAQPPFTLPEPTEEEQLVPLQMVGEPMAKTDAPLTLAAASTGGWGGHPPLPGVILDKRFDFSSLPDSIRNPPSSTTAEAFAQRMAQRLRSIGRYRFVPSVGSCVAPVPSPRLTPGSMEPLIGKEIVLTGDRIAADWVPVVMAQIEANPATDRDTDISIFGLHGCRLHLELEKIVWVSGLDERQPDGSVQIKWTPTPAFLGYTVTWQLLCLVPGVVVASERLVSNAVQVIPGDL